uniref:F-box domain-containing protein n=1 Tax=Oryza punctata TaxID=4537 RepID=A0A0E0M588_ORYPU
MLMQLKMLTEAMYEGYHIFDTYGPLELIKEAGEVSDSYALDFHYVRRFHLYDGTIVRREVKSSLENLETVLDNLKEFVSLLNGCERMFRNPYSSYLYIDNFMFGRQVERQQIMSILMLDDHRKIPAVLPIIGGCRVGKKTLVWSVCSDERIRSHFSTILHLSGDDIKKFDERRVMPIKTLITVEFISDISDFEWLNFYSLVASSGNGSKVIIISRLEKVARFGTVNSIELRNFSHEEYSYLFKVLAFGSSNPLDHPRLAIIGKEIARTLQGSLVAINIYAHVLRNNFSVPFWIRVLNLYKGMMESNLSLYGEHPKSLLQKDGTIIDITAFCPSFATNSFRITLLTGEKFKYDNKRELPVMGFGDIIAGSVTMPMKFQLVWESRPSRAETAVLRLCAHGDHVVFYGYLTGDANRTTRHWACIDALLFVPVLSGGLDATAHALANDAAGAGIWKKLAGGLGRRLFVDMCRKNSKLLPRRLTSLPADLQEDILRRLAVEDITAMYFTCTGGHRSSKSNDVVYRRRR